MMFRWKPMVVSEFFMSWRCGMSVRPAHGLGMDVNDIVSFQKHCNDPGQGYGTYQN